MEVIPIEQLRSAVAQAIMEACRGVDDVRGMGIIIDMPESVDFQCVVVTGWQALEIRSESIGTSEDTRAGGESSTRDETSESNESGTARTASGHDQTTDTEYEFIDR